MSKIEIDFGLAYFSYIILKSIENNSTSLGGIVKDWKEILDKEDHNLMKLLETFKY